MELAPDHPTEAEPRYKKIIMRPEEIDRLAAYLLMQAFRRYLQGVNKTYKYF